MSDAAVLWLDDGQARDDAVRALSEWARARGVTLQSIDDGAAAARPPVKTDLTIADRVEKELDRAREAIGSNDADTAERALARAETTLREHPELPQAAWLRAEAERTWSVRFTRIEPRDETRARIAWENAEALDGGRVPGIGEPTFGGKPPAPSPKVKASFVLGSSAARARDAVVRLDGRILTPAGPDGMTFEADVAPAEHQVLVTTADGSRVLFAAWIAPSAGGSKIRMGLADGGACTREALNGVHRDASDPTHVVVPAGVSCSSYLAVAPGEKKGSIFVARCEGEACGPLLEWRVERYGAGGPPQTTTKSSWPTWATWTLLGIGAATATSVALIATGVFDQRPVEPRFVVGGARQE